MTSAGNHPSYRLVRQHIWRNVKQTLMANGLQSSTRRGNRELNIVVRQLARTPFASLEAAAQAGQTLGQEIATLSQARGKQHLDQGIIRLLAVAGNLPAPSAAPTVSGTPEAGATAMAAEAEALLDPATFADERAEVLEEALPEAVVAEEAPLPVSDAETTAEVSSEAEEATAGDIEDGGIAAEETPEAEETPVAASAIEGAPDTEEAAIGVMAGDATPAEGDSPEAGAIEELIDNEAIDTPRMEEGTEAPV